MHITPTLFAEIIVGAVTGVWIMSFVANLLTPQYDPSAYNNIFMVVVGSGLGVTALASKFKNGGPKP
jgi:hypothetical protein